MQRKHREKSATQIEKHNSNKKAWQLKQKSTTQTKKHNSNKEAQHKQKRTTQTKKHNANKTLAVRISGALAQNPLTPGLLMHKVSKPQSFSDFEFFPETKHYFLLRSSFLFCLHCALLLALCFFNLNLFAHCVVFSVPRSCASKLMYGSFL